VLFLFRNNQISTAVLLAVYVLLTHLAAISGYLPIPHSGGGGSGLLYESIFGWLAGLPYVSAIIAAMLVFLQAFMVNQLADTFRLLGDRNWLPGLFYVFAVSAIPDFLFLSPALVATTFIPLVLRKIFHSYKTPQATALIFDAGFWMTVGSLFYPPMLLLMLAAYVGVNVMRSFSLREQMVFWIGLLVPFFLAWLFYFWNDRGMEFWGAQAGRVRETGQFPGWQDIRYVFEIGFLVLMLAMVVLNFGLFYRRKLIQAQKCITVLYWFVCIGVLSVFLQSGINLSHAAVVMPGVGVFLSMWLSSFKRRFIAEIIHVVLLIVLLAIQYIPG
jgi:hypothetical protein